MIKSKKCYFETSFDEFKNNILDVEYISFTDEHDLFFILRKPEGVILDMLDVTSESDEDELKFVEWMSECIILIVPIMVIF